MLTVTSSMTTFPQSSDSGLQSRLTPSRVIQVPRASDTVTRDARGAKGNQPSSPSMLTIVPSLDAALPTASATSRRTGAS